MNDRNPKCSTKIKLSSNEQKYKEIKVMITEIQLENFRCFENHVIPLKPTTIIVGKNNAGKSTIVEAIRLISLVTSRYKSLNFKDAPLWTRLPRVARGVVPSLKGLELNFERSTFYGYREPPAIIQASFDSGESIKVYIGMDNQIFAILIDKKGDIIKTRAQAATLDILSVQILPQVAPLTREERLLTHDYVVGTMTTTLSHLHFRNELTIFKDKYDDFKRLAEASWKGLQIRELDVDGEGDNNTIISLMLRDGDFVGEASSMGHGLQMWLQTMWFLARVDQNSTLILDEPDVYMHADLQRKLIRMLDQRYKQTIIATHSVEIMAEVEPENILIIDRSKPKSKFASSLPAVQRLIEHIGGVHNIQLARLWASKKCLLVEGKDVGVLKHIQKILFPESEEPFETIPNLSIGGWGGWNYAVGSAMILKNAADEAIKVYCLFDRDYHTAEEIEERLLEAKKRKVELHIWNLKEIENYLLVPDAINRIIISELRDGKPIPSINEIEKQMELITDDMYTETVDIIADEMNRRDKSLGVKTVNMKARDYVQPHWTTLDGRLTLVSGKKLISLLSFWSKDMYGVSFNSSKIARELQIHEIREEIRQFITKIENHDSLS